MDGGGHARIAGLGTAFVRPATSAFDVDRSFHDTAPELINPWGWGLHDGGAAMAGDMLAFAILAWEVRMKFTVSLDRPLNEAGFVARFSLGDLRSAE